MVFFTCNSCGESLKKKQVEKHVFRCRQCQSVTCIDCHQEFYGNDYVSHVKCITEEEKYSAKGWQPKASANKGARKQETWIENVTILLNDSSVTQDVDDDVRRVLEAVMRHENIPRKRQKFVNFVKNIIRGVRPATIDKTWDLLEQATKKDDKANDGEQNGNAEETSTTPEMSKSKDGIVMFGGTSTLSIDDNAQNKEAEEAVTSTEKKRKRKADVSAEEPVKKTKKKQVNADDNDPRSANTDKNPDVNAVESNGVTNGRIKPDEKEMISKFSWDKTIENVVSKKNGQIKLSKLKKKVICAYIEAHVTTGTRLTREQLQTKLEKKLKKSKKFVIVKDVVRLKSS